MFSSVIRPRGTTFTVVLVAALASACSRDTGRSNELGSDPALERDLSMVQQTQQPPALQDVPTQAPPVQPPVAQPAQRVATPQRTQTPPPRTQAPPPATTPAPVQPAPEPAVVPLEAPKSGMISAGTALSLTSNSRICTTAGRGEKFTARLAQAVNGTNNVSIPAGATVVVEVASVTEATNDQPAAIAFRVRSIESGGQIYTVAGTGAAVGELERVRTTERKDDAKKVAGGAIAGAILGQMIGKDTRGTVIGAAAGAAAGTAAAAATGTYAGCLNENGTIRITLSDAIIIPIA